MSADALIEGLPDLVVLIRRDGLVLECGGGHGVPGLRCRLDAAGKRSSRDDSLEGSDERPRPQLDRRGFLRRCKESMAMAALRERPLAVAVIQLDGISDIAQIIATKVSEQIMSTAILRLPAKSDERDGKPWWYLGQLSESLLALVLESADREAIGECVAGLSASLREPIAIGGAEFHLTPYVGVAILGQDASTPKLLLDHARAAATEARRRGSSEVCFFTDTMRLESLARLDIAREMREAIAHHDIRLRYVGRHDLETGRLTAWVGYLRWLHPLRGEIRPAEFLRVAETTGLAAQLSRAVLGCLKDDFASLAAAADPDVRVSFGALAERALVARDPLDLHDLARLGARVVVDEVARGMGSLELLARAPLWGLQLDRAWVTGLRRETQSRKVCQAGIAVAQAFGLTPIASGVDDSGQREALLALGCRYGSGDLFRDAAPDITAPARAAVGA